MLGQEHPLLAALGSWSHLPIPLALCCPESSVKLWSLCPASSGAQLVVPSEHLEHVRKTLKCLLAGRRSLWTHPGAQSRELGRPRGGSRACGLSPGAQSREVGRPCGGGGACGLSPGAQSREIGRPWGGSGACGLTLGSRAESSGGLVGEAEPMDSALGHRAESSGGLAGEAESGRGCGGLMV